MALDKPRKISVVVDNDSWVLPYAERLVRMACEDGDDAKLCRTHEDVSEGAIAFYLGCVNITPQDVLARNIKNLVVHASDLPKGRGFSPWAWSVINGENVIPICLLEAEIEVDSGPVVYRDVFVLDGHELVDEIRAVLGEKQVELCLRYLRESDLLSGVPQEGEASVCERRWPRHSQLDPDKTIAEQFDLMRIVDNEKYPAFFEYCGSRYQLLIRKDDRDKIK